MNKQTVKPRWPVGLLMAAASLACMAAPQSVATKPTPASTPTAVTKDDAKDINLTKPTPDTAAPRVAPSKPDATDMDAALSSALSELALELMRGQSAASGNAQVNSVVSSLSVASSLGMVHAGTSGVGARELGTLLSNAPRTGVRAYEQGLPSMLNRLRQAGTRTGAFVMANRVWLDEAVVPVIPVSYTKTIDKRYKADGAVVQFTKATEARKSINDWVSESTNQRIPELMPEGSITPNTKLVVTNAIYFKSPWEKPFDLEKTVEKPFFTDGKASKLVPTMVDERSVRTGVVRSTTVFELPFAGKEFSLLIGMPPVGHSLDALEKDLLGTTMSTWSSQLKTSVCSLEMPKFTIAPSSKPLKEILQDYGVKTIFGPDANLTAMLGGAAKGVYVDNIYHSATIVIDELGGEAAAATGATTQSKGFNVDLPPVCSVNRPFIFAIMHTASSAPLFVGKVADPTLK